MSLAASAISWPLCPESQHEPPVPIHEHIPHQNHQDPGVPLRATTLASSSSDTGPIAVPTDWMTVPGYQPVRVPFNPAVGSTIVDVTSLMDDED